jgi:alpha-tubulin suppressor-like RCC1 family protein
VYSRFTEVEIKAVSGITMIAAGEDFSLAMSRSGNLYSTGSGKYGIHGLGCEN